MDYFRAARARTPQSLTFSRGGVRPPGDPPCIILGHFIVRPEICYNDSETYSGEAGIQREAESRRVALTVSCAVIAFAEGLTAARMAVS